MFFRQYNSFVSQANKGFAKAMFILGLLLIGFAMLVWVLRDIFVFIAAGIFVIAGIGCLTTAVKAWFFASRFKSNQNEESSYRENVRIHYEENNF